MYGHDSPHAQEETLDLPQRLATLPDKQHFQNDSRHLFHYCWDNNQYDNITTLKKKETQRNSQNGNKFGDAINHLGTREDQAFFCFTKIIATWICGWGLGDSMHGWDENEDGNDDHDNFQVRLWIRMVMMMVMWVYML